MLPASARRFAHLDLEAAQQAFNTFMRDCQPEDRLRRIGSLVELWKERPPQPPQRPQPRQRLDMDVAMALAIDIAPGVEGYDLSLLAVDLAEGKPQEEALMALKNRQLFALQWEQRRERQQARP